MMARTFPFSIRQVAGLMELKTRYDNRDNGNMDVDCPFCKKKSKMNLNAESNIYRCNSCNTGGGMVDLYAKVNRISNSEAYREICEILGCNKASLIDSDRPALKQPRRADKDTMHQTYSMLLSMLSLATPHKNQLLSRGLTEGQIADFKYKSVPAFGRRRLCGKLLDSGCSLEGVPGFFKENGVWDVKLKAPGIIIPVCGIDGKIAGIQIRLCKPVNNRKYIWLSSPGLDSGASSGAPIHFVGDPAAKRVYVTDGALKGTVAHVLSRFTFVCLPGVKNLSGLDDLLSCLIANGTTDALEAFNLNKLTDEKAGESASSLREKLFAHGFNVTSAVWGDKSLESVDDYFLQRVKAKKNHVYDVDIFAAAIVQQK